MCKKPEMRTSNWKNIDVCLFCGGMKMALENKFGITDSLELAMTEEKISKMKAVELFDSDIISNLEIGKFSSLAKIHEYLFGEIYDFAGKV